MSRDFSLSRLLPILGHAAKVLLKELMEGVSKQVIHDKKKGGDGGGSSITTITPDDM